MNNARCRKGGASLRRPYWRPFGNQRQHNKLQSDQRAGRGANDYIEVTPLGEFWHVVKSSVSCTSATSQSLEVFRVTSSLHFDLRRGVVNLIQIVSSKLSRGRADVLFQPMQFRGARDR